MVGFPPRKSPHRTAGSNDSTLENKSQRVKAVGVHLVVMPKILFVCVGRNNHKITIPTLNFPNVSGNSCRSPMAESVMRNLVSVDGGVAASSWTIDSAAIADWNVGRRSEPRALAVLAANGLDSQHIARQLCCDDFHTFDYIFGMDDSNMEDLRQLAAVYGGESGAQLRLLGEFDDDGATDGVEIADPYFVSGLRVLGIFREMLIENHVIFAHQTERWHREL